MYKLATKILMLIVGGYVAISAPEAFAVQSKEEILEELAETRAALSKLEKIVSDLEKRLAENESTGVSHVVERVEELESIAIAVDDKIGGNTLVNSFSASSLDIGGFFDNTVSIVTGEGNSEATFNRQVFELLVKAELGEDWDFFVAQAFVRDVPLEFLDPDQRQFPTFGNNKLPIETDTVLAWGQYHVSDALNIQFGRFITPQGIINIEHFPASLLDTEQPLFLRPFNKQTIFSNFTNGINFTGNKFLRGQNKISYAAYAGVWAGNADSLVFGGRVAHSWDRRGLTIGLNGNSGDRTSEIEGGRFYTGGLDVLIDKGPVLWKSEVFTTSEDNASNRLGLYTQPAYRIRPNLMAFYRFDYLDTGLVGDERIEHVLGLVYNPINQVRLRAIYRNRRFLEDNSIEDAIIEDASLNIFQFSTTLNF